MRADVVIVGAGTAGSAAALHAARRGLSVLCVDRRAVEQAGARWVNGVPAWMFGEAGIEPPSGAELVGAPSPFHLLVGRGPRRIVVRDHDLCDVDMRLLVQRLQDGARAAGARFLGDVDVRGFDGRALHTSVGPVEGRFYVDASGLSGARLLAPAPIARRDLCAAAQEVRAVADVRAAHAFLAQHEVREGETLSFAGLAGGYSVLNVRVEGDEVGLLTGSIPADGHPAGPAILASFVAEQRWIGARRFGGARAIPAPPPARAAFGRAIAAIGDAASHVFSAHGSGIGVGMIAARTLAEELATTGDTWAWAARFQRTWGGLLATWDQLRRATQSLDLAAIDRLVAAGLVDEASTRDALAQRWPSLSAKTAASRLAGLAREPRLGGRLSPYLARAAAARGLYARFPRHPSGLAAWSALADRLLGDARV